MAALRPLVQAGGQRKLLPAGDALLIGLAALGASALSSVRAIELPDASGALLISTPSLGALGVLTPEADRLPYFTGSGAASTTALPAFGRMLIGQADAGAARSVLGLNSMSTQAADNVAITGGSAGFTGDVYSTGQLRQRGDATAGGLAAVAIDNAAGLSRWKLARRNVETGTGDTGHDLALWSYTDAGAFKTTVVTAFRATSNVAIASTVDAGYRLDVNGTLRAQGDLTLSGTGRRILADFSNATVANRTAFQTNVANSFTSLGLLPNGTSTASGVNAFAAPDAANASYGAFGVNGANGYAFLNSGLTGSGSQLPLDLQLAGSTCLRVFTSRRIGINTLTDNGVGQLQVAGPTSILGVDGTLLAIQYTGTSGASGVNILNASNIGMRQLVYGSAYVGGSLFGIGANGAGIAENGAVSALAFGTVENIPVVFGASNVEAYRIAPTTRNILIRTTTDNGTDAIQTPGSVLFGAAALRTSGVGALALARTTIPAGVSGGPAISFQAYYSGTTLGTGAEIATRSTSTWSGSNRGMEVVINTCAAGSSSLVTRLALGAVGATFSVPVIQVLSASVTPANNGELMVQATSNTSLTFKYKGSDGTVRSASLALA